MAFTPCHVHVRGCRQNSERTVDCVQFKPDIQYISPTLPNGAAYLREGKVRGNKEQQDEAESSLEGVHRSDISRDCLICTGYCRRSENRGDASAGSKSVSNVGCGSRLRVCAPALPTLF